MDTRFKLIFEGEPDIELEKFQRSLPNSFKATQEKDGIYVTIPTTAAEDVKAQYLIDRELDRHFFLTCVKIEAHMVRRRVSKEFTALWRIHGALDKDISPQNWNYDLAVQLRLWSIACDSKDWLVQVILFYQIIEISNKQKSSSSKYVDSSKAPDPTMECRFIRNLAAHSGDVRDPQLKTYCDYLGIPDVMHDPTDPGFVETIKNKIPFLKQEAEKEIKKSL